MTITYIYHSGFVVETEKAFVVIDYWHDTDDGLVARIVAQSAKVVYFLSSHVHHDHFNPEIIFMGPHMRYVLSADIRRKNKILRDDVRIAWVHRGEMYEDDNIRVWALGSTDVGVSFCIEADGRKVFHAGDFNNWQRTMADSETNKQMAGYFMAELKKMEPVVAMCDAAMFPVDPRLEQYMAMGAIEFCKSVHPKMLLPMHCWEMYEEANEAAAFIEATGTRFIASPMDETIAIE